jgi:hypothetical protein
MAGWFSTGFQGSTVPAPHRIVHKHK